MVTNGAVDSAPIGTQSRMLLDENTRNQLDKRRDSMDAHLMS